MLEKLFLAFLVSEPFSFNGKMIKVDFIKCLVLLMCYYN